MSYLQIISLALVEGITEFLPISSSAHLILLFRATGWADQGLGFDLALHLGALAAIVVVFYERLWALIRDGLLMVVHRRSCKEGLLAWKLALATCPALVMGYLLLDYIDGVLRSVQVICATTLGYAFIMLLAELLVRRRNKGGEERSALKSLDQISFTDSLVIGFAQALSLVPGTSRSGATITAGLFMGFGHRVATQFSFLLAVPITLAAALVVLIKIINNTNHIDIQALMLGAVLSFLAALLAIRLFMSWVSRVGLWPFIWYRLLLGVVLLIWIYA